MAGFLSSITAALGGGSSNPTPNGPTNTNGSNGTPANSSGATTQTFDNAGNPVGPTGDNNGNPNPNSVGSPGSGTNSSAAGAGTTPSIEELLFAPPADQTKKDQPTTENETTPANKNAPAEIVPGLTAQQLLQNLGSVNYTQTIPPELMTNALGGDVESFNKVISTVAQLSAAIAVQQSVMANKALLDDRFKNFDTQVSSKIGEAKYQDVLADPKFSNPFVQPLAQTLMAKLRERDPSITPDQIRSTLPQLIEYSMKQFQSGNQNPSNQNPSNRSNNPRIQPREVNFEELF